MDFVLMDQIVTPINISFLIVSQCWLIEYDLVYHVI